MPKRGRGSESLTGGTGDVNPQWFTMLASANFTTSPATTTVPTPINKFPEGSGRVVIMEILKVLLYISESSLTNYVAATGYQYEVYLTTKNYGTTEAPVSDGNVICKFQRDTFADAASTGRVAYDWPMIIDLTDGAGHGMLVATDNLYLQILATSASVPSASFATLKILYRFKKVSLQEYIGIVQSQQT